jgi:hypothetical protein
MVTLRTIVPCLIAAGCAASSSSPLTAADHERRAQSYSATADSIELDCWNALRNELTVDPSTTVCWKAEDIRFLDANRNAAASHRAAAATLRTQTARR